jgi:hypothetical protein
VVIQRGADDRLPDRFFEEAIETGPKAGVRLDREACAQSIAKFAGSLRR